MIDIEDDFAVRWEVVQSISCNDLYLGAVRKLALDFNGVGASYSGECR
jgi:hypothetical protein